MTIRKRRDRDGWLVTAEQHGTRLRRQVSGTKWEAQRVELELRRTLREGRPHLGLSEVLTAYLAYLRVRGKPSSVASATFHSRVLERLLGTHFNLAELSGRNLDGIVRDLRAEKWRDTSINGSLRHLRAAINHAYRERRLADPPRVPMLRELRALPTVLAPDQVEALVAAASPEAGMAILLAAHAGLRHQEILHLRLEDVRGDELRVTAKPGWSPKAHAERTVPINRRLRAALDAFMGDGTKVQKLPITWLFPHHDGTPIASLDKSVRGAFRRAGLWDPKLRPGLHLLRRTFATRLAAKGFPLVTIMRLGGWANLATVQRYLASDPEVERRAVAALED